MNRQLLILLSLPVFFLMLAGHGTTTEIPSVDEICARAKKVAYYAGENGRTEVKMTITDAQGRARIRELPTRIQAVSPEMILAAVSRIRCQARVTCSSSVRACPTEKRSV